MSRRQERDLHLDAATAEEAVGRRVARRMEFEGLSYVRFSGRGGFARGSVFLEGRVVPPYPSVGRIFALREGVRRNLAGPFAVEEKIDGYNVRIARVAGRLVAVVRSGYVCPFTTDRLPDLAPLEPLFDEDPDLVLCAEVAGPENPYIHGQVPHVSEDVQLFAFDLMRLDRAGVLPPAQARERLERHGLPRVPQLGILGPDDPEGLRRVALELDAQGSEGMVLKPLDGDADPVKYVTPSVNLADVVDDASLLAELPSEFFSSRIVRLAIGLDELDLRERLPETEARLGRALLEEFEGTLRDFRKSGVVSQVFRVRVRRPERLDALLEHVKSISKRVNVHELSREFDGTHHRMAFRKIFQRSTSWLHSVLDGAAVFD